MIIANNIVIKIYIESGDVFELFREYKESKVNPNFPLDNIWLLRCFLKYVSCFFYFNAFGVLVNDILKQFSWR